MPPPPPPRPPPAVAGHAPNAPPPSHIDAAIHQCSNSAALHNASSSTRPSGAAPPAQPAIAIVPSGSTYNFFEFFLSSRYRYVLNHCYHFLDPALPDGSLYCGRQDSFEKVQQHNSRAAAKLVYPRDACLGRDGLGSRHPVNSSCPRLESLQRELNRLLSPECLEYRVYLREHVRGHALSCHCLPRRAKADTFAVEEHGCHCALAALIAF